MANRKSRSSRHSHKSTPIVTYTVTVGHEPGSECDSCSMPRSVLIEQESGAWICQMCSGEGMTSGALWRSAMVGGLYSWGGGDGL